MEKVGPGETGTVQSTGSLFPFSPKKKGGIRRGKKGVRLRHAILFYNREGRLPAKANIRERTVGLGGGAPGHPGRGKKTRLLMRLTWGKGKTEKRRQDE